MCEPVTALTAVSGALKAFGGLRAARDQKDAAARDWERQMEIRNLNLISDTNRYNLKLIRYDQQIDENAMAVYEAYAKEQAWLNDQYDAATVKYQDAFIKAARSAKYYGEGRTDKRRESSSFADLGYMQSILVSNLTRAGEKVEGANRKAARQFKFANRRAFDSLGAVPMPTIAPPKPDMNMTSAYINFGAGLLTTAASSASAFAASKPPTTPFVDQYDGFKSFDVNSSSLFDYKPEFSFNSLSSYFTD